MATNQFPTFAASGGANVLSPAAWSSLAALLSNGFQTGVADSAQMNTVFRQAMFGAAALAKIIADDGVDALDDGNLAVFVTNLKAALTTATAGDAVMHSELTGTNQSLTASGFQKLPGGLILQWGTFSAADLPGGSWFTQVVSFPIAFPSACVLPPVGLYDSLVSDSKIDQYFSAKSNSGFTVKIAESASIVQDITGFWYAIGF